MHCPAIEVSIGMPCEALPPMLALTFSVASVQAAKWLQEDPSLAGKLKFRTDELQFRIYDRLLAPHAPETFAAVKGDLEKLVAGAWGAAPALMNFVPAEQSLFEVQIKAPSSPTLGQLLERLA